MNVIVENTKRFIEKKGLKQKAVAERAGYSPKKFSDMLNNRSIIRSSDILKISKALDVTPNDLFGLSAKKGA